MTQQGKQSELDFDFEPLPHILAKARLTMYPTGSLREHECASASRASSSMLFSGPGEPGPTLQDFQVDTTANFRLKLEGPT